MSWLFVTHLPLNVIYQCATFVGTVTYMSPERIRNESYSYPADIWSLGLALFECGTGEFPYSANEGPVNLMLQVTCQCLSKLYVPYFMLHLSKDKWEALVSKQIAFLNFHADTFTRNQYKNSL